MISSLEKKSFSCGLLSIVRDTCSHVLCQIVPLHSSVSFISPQSPTLVVPLKSAIKITIPEQLFAHYIFTLLINSYIKLAIDTTCTLLILMWINSSHSSAICSDSPFCLALFDWSLARLALDWSLTQMSLQSLHIYSYRSKRNVVPTDIPTKPSRIAPTLGSFQLLLLNLYFFPHQKSIILIRH